MKPSLLIVLALSLILSGCALFSTSPTWEAVVSSHDGYSSGADPKDGYINHLHQVLSNAGVEHKIVTYQFHFHNAYREEGMDTAVAILYRDETTPRDPWWGMDEYHQVPVWLPSWEVDRQVGFFMQRQVEVISVKEYRASGRRGGEGKAERPLAARKSQKSQDLKSRSLFANAPVKLRGDRPAKPAAPREKRAPLVAVSPAPKAKVLPAAKADAIFRSVHGSTFDPTSSVDRQKMASLRRLLLNRNQTARLRQD